MFEAITKLDIQILLFLQEHVRSSVLTPIMKFITFLGESGWFWIALSVLLFVVGSVKKNGSLGTVSYATLQKAGAFSFLSIAVGFLITNVTLKNLVARIRPFNLCEDLIPLVAKPDDFSFPSGHATASFAAALVLCRYLPKKAGAPLVVLAVLIAFSRLYVGVHYPTDVLAGFLVGLIASLLMKLCAKVWENRK